MYFRKIGTIALSGLALIMAACGGGKVPSVSQTEYILLPPGNEGLLHDIERDEIDICYSGIRGQEENVEYSILEWIDSLRDVAEVQLASVVNIVGANDPCQASVKINSSGGAYTYPGRKPALTFTNNGWYGSLGVILHEFGHAFGLADTYSGRGGSCKPNQPSSVMCYAKFESLQDDDIAGMRDLYNRVKTR